MRDGSRCHQRGERLQPIPRVSNIPDDARESGRGLPAVSGWIVAVAIVQENDRARV